MSKEKLTPFFPGKIKPVRRGTYIVFMNGFRYWNGKVWKFTKNSPVICTQQNLPWRGLAEKPKRKT